MRNQSSFTYILVLTLLVGCSTTSPISEKPIPVAERKDSSAIVSQVDSIPGLPDFDSLLTVLPDSIDPALIEPDDLADSDEVPEPVLTDSTLSEEPIDQEEPISSPEISESVPKPIVDIEPEQSPTPELPASANNIPAPVAMPPVPKPTPKPEKKDPVPVSVTEPAFDFRNMNKNAYLTGEELRFDIRYGLIVAGEGTMSVDKEFSYKDRTVQRVFFEAKSSSAFSWIYKVHNQYISYLDKYGIYPWKYIQKTREGNYKRDVEVEFDHLKGLAFEKKKEFQIPKYTHDIISAFYYFRNLDLKSAKKGDMIKLSNYSRGKVFPLDVEIKGWQRVTVPAGTFDCIVLEPLVKAGGLFKNEGTLFVWLTNDDLKIPVKVETKVLVGSIQVELREYKGINRTIPAKVK